MFFTRNPLKTDEIDPILTFFSFTGCCFFSVFLPHRPEPPNKGKWRNLNDSKSWEQTTGPDRGTELRKNSEHQFPKCQRGSGRERDPRTWRYHDRTST